MMVYLVYSWILNFLYSYSGVLLGTLVLRPKHTYSLTSQGKGKEAGGLPGCSFSTSRMQGNLA